MTKHSYNLGRRGMLALGAAASLAGWRALAAEAALPDIPPIPEKLKGSGELRIAAYGGTAQDAERKAYFQPFEAMSGIKVHDFPGADLNKVKAMVDTGNVEWDVVQLSQGSVANLRKHGDYFEKIDYDLVDTANIDAMYRSDYACDMLVWSEVMSYRTDAFNGAVPVQLLTDKEVVLTSVWNGRMAAIQAAGVPAAISWDQGMLKRDCWAVPKGSPNKANAMKFIAFSTMAVPQARLSSLIPYGFVNSKSPDYVAPKQLALLPSAPEIKAKLVPYDYEWWSQNRDAVIGRWNKWILA
jgi:spermidine/putrescine-binding protein